MAGLIQKYYKNWINTNTLIIDGADEYEFYKFVKACKKYDRKKRNGRKTWDVGYLKCQLEKDFKNRFIKDYRKDLISNIIDKFQTIIEYEKAEFPNYILEMRNPYRVKDALLRLIKLDGSQYYSDDEISKRLEKNFGKDWKEIWYKKIYK